ncbi:MAG: hypothetical protein AAFY91_10870 [Bacteroidota bacterium]
MVQTVISSTSNVSLGDVSVSLETPTQGEIKEFRGDRSTDVVLPSGAYSIFVQHVDPTGGTINVNGQDLEFNEIFTVEARFDRPSNRQDFPPAVTITANGKEYALRVEYPSDSPFDPSTL